MTFQPVAEHLRKIASWRVPGTLFGLGMKILKNWLLELSWSDFSAACWKSLKTMSGSLPGMTFQLVVEHLEKYDFGAFLEWLFGLWLKILKKTALHSDQKVGPGLPETRFQTVLGSDQKHAPGRFQGDAFKHLQAHNKKPLQEAFRTLFSNIFKFIKKDCSKRLPGGAFRPTPATNSIPCAAHELHVH